MKAEQAPLIEARGVTFRVGRHTLLENVDVAVRPGEIVTLIGPNGAGKSTLARLLLGILKPQLGQVISRPGLSLGYVPQRLEIDRIFPLTVRRFLTIGGGRKAGPPGQILAEVGAEHLADAMIHSLSGGEFQRVLLARALLREPELLLLDEPVAGVDVTGQIYLFDLITRIRRERGCGVLLISHDLHLVMAATDRVVCLNRHVCCFGKPAAVVRDPAYINLFGERAVSGLAVYSHEHDHTHEPATPPAPEP